MDFGLSSLDTAARTRYIRTHGMNPTEIIEAKARARQAVDESLARLPPSRRRAASIAAAQKLTSLPEVRRARTLMVFLSLSSEIDTWPILRWAWREGKRVVIPRIEPAPPGAKSPPRGRPMAAVLLEAADVPAAGAHPAVRPGPLGILIAPDAPTVPVGEIDVVLVPCQAVDHAGHRLGKGGGFFDRFLAQPDLRARRIAVALHEQLLDEVPVADGDQRVDMLVTDAEVLSFRG